jgi:uncharacterized membrane protein (UPF0127 family)
VLISISICAYTILLTNPKRDTNEFTIPAFFINQQGQKVELKLKLATSQREKERGLMFTTKLDKSHGMAFTYNQPKKLTFWMKNTFIPLYIIFIDQNSLITNIYQAPQLNSELLYSSNSQSSLVVEVSTENTQMQSLKIGDKFFFLTTP